MDNSSIVLVYFLARTILPNLLFMDEGVLLALLHVVKTVFVQSRAAVIARCQEHASAATRHRRSGGKSPLHLGLCKDDKAGHE